MQTFKDIHKALLSGEADCASFVREVLADISANGDLNAFVETFDRSVLKQAEKLQKDVDNNKAGRLTGMIVGIKDNICYKDHEVTASSAILNGFESLFSATVVERLVGEGAIIIGRLGCDEFAMGSSNENSVYGPVKNPLDKTKVPGGSSGGAAAAVAANLCHVTLGSDTGGSIRQPASFTGTFGFKPTYGRVSRHGLIAYASSFDQIGPIASNIDDLALVMEIMSGEDAFDSTCVPKEVPVYSQFEDVKKKLTIGYYKSYVEHEGLDSEVKERFFELLNQLQRDGHTIMPFDFPYLDHMVPTYYVLTTAEASSNLARYDGIHYGFRSEEAKDLESAYINSRSEGFGTEVKRRIMLGTYVLSAGYYDAYYTKGQKVRRLIRNATEETFLSCDFVLSPTSPHTAFPIASQDNDPIKMYLEDIFTVQANLAGNPAVSLPIGQHSNGLPFGIQVMGKMFGEKEIFNFSKSLINKTRLVSHSGM